MASRPPQLIPAHKALFLAAASWGVVAVAGWLAMPAGLLLPPPRLTPVQWHAHEMLFGFAGAAMGGFLVARAERRAVALLVLSWLLARIAVWMPATPAPVFLLIYPALLVYGVSPAFLADPKRWSAVIFGLVPVAFMVLEAVVVLGLIREEPKRVDGALRSALALVALLLAAMGGRILRAATAGVVQRSGRRYAAELGTSLEAAVVVLLAGAMAALFQEAGRQLAGAALFLAGALTGLRLWRWRAAEAWRVPEVAMLHLGYGWLAAGLVLWGLGELGVLPAPASVHGVAIGALGTLAFTVMARTTVQRAGRDFADARPLARLAPLFSLAVVARLLADAFLGLAPSLLGVAGLIWCWLFGLLALRLATLPAYPNLQDNRP